MMRESDKPFVLYRRGPWNFTITPRGKAGWMQFGAWMAVFAVMTAAFAIYGESVESRPEFPVALAIYLAAVLVWSLAIIRWMKARSEVVDVQEMIRLKHRNEREQGR